MRSESEGDQLEKYAELINPYSEQPLEKAELATAQGYKFELTATSQKEAIIKNYQPGEYTDLYGGTNEALIVSLENDGSVVFKPKDGEKNLGRKGVPVGSYYTREAATYQISRDLGFDLVPPTVIREIFDQVGSAQEFIPNTRRINSTDLKDLEDSIYNQWILDILVWSSDRKANNFLVTKESTIASIDNGLTFGHDNLKLYGDFINRPASPEVVELFKNLNQDPAIIDRIKTSLQELIPVEEVEAFMDRLQILTQAITTRGCIQEADIRYDLSTPKTYFTNSQGL